MKFSFSPKRTQLFKKYMLSALLLFVATFLEIYWAMGSFSEKISSGCLNCSFKEDVFRISLMTVFLLVIVFLFLSLIKNRSFRNIIQWIFLNLVWLFWNYTVFVDRESSWSTYTFNEEIHFTIFYSILPILVLSTITVFALDYILRSYESK